jgi:hypothetical protein
MKQGDDLVEEINKSECGTFDAYVHAPYFPQSILQVCFRITSACPAADSNFDASVRCQVQIWS